ncbi:hypothetical protein [Nostoc sp.]
MLKQMEHEQLAAYLIYSGSSYQNANSEVELREAQHSFLQELAGK